jgi:hypothetical protein
LNYPDWTAYDSGEMGTSARAQADGLLFESERARLDYAGFKEYRTVLRQSVLADPAPQERLELMLRRTASSTRMPKFMVPLFAGVAVFVLAYFIGPQFLWREVAKPPGEVMLGGPPLLQQEAHFATSDPRQAYRWIGKEVNFVVFNYDLRRVAKLTGASAGKGWGAYEYECDGQPIQIVIRPNKYQFEIPKTESVGQTTFWVGNSLGFKCPYCAYEIKGADNKTRWKMAKAAAREVLGPQAVD